MTRDELINAIDSPIVQALARVFDTPPQRMDKSFSEQIVEILAPKLISVRAQQTLVPAGKQAKFKHAAGDWFGVFDWHDNPESFEYRTVYALTSTPGEPAQCALRDALQQARASLEWLNRNGGLEHDLREFIKTALEDTALPSAPNAPAAALMALTIEECAKIAESSAVTRDGVKIGIGIATKIRALSAVTLSNAPAAQGAPEAITQNELALIVFDADRTASRYPIASLILQNFNVTRKTSAVTSTERLSVPPGHELCASCGRLFKWGETCTRGGCPCGGDV